MSMAGLRVEDRLAGASNWSPWKARIVLILEELELWDIVSSPMVLPPVTAVFVISLNPQIRIYASTADY
jgi:hypothetical protein